MDPANTDEALREVELDIPRAPDMVMVKPGPAYLDILQRIKDSLNGLPLPTKFSGEYAMIWPPPECWARRRQGDDGSPDCL